MLKPSSKGPVIVTQNKDFVFDTSELEITGMQAFDFLSENTRGRLSADGDIDEDHTVVEDEIDEHTDLSAGNTTAYNEFEDVAGTSARFVDADPVMYNCCKAVHQGE